jgi:hypothetical protein
MKLARTSVALRRDSTSVSSSAQNNAKNKPSHRLKKQNEETETHSPVHQRSDSVRCERASAASSSSEVTIVLMVANSSWASWSRVGIPQDVTCWACPYPNMEITLGLRRRWREGAPSPSPGAPMHEPLEESSCSMTMAEVAKKDRKQGRRKGDAKVGHHSLGYKGPQGGLSIAVAINTSPIHQLPYSSLEGAVVVSHHASGRRTVLADSTRSIEPRQESRAKGPTPHVRKKSGHLPTFSRTGT